MQPSLILTALCEALKTSQHLSGKVAASNIFLGQRENISTYPVIVINPGPKRKVRDVYPFEEWNMSVTVAFGVQIYDEEKQIVGDESLPGIIDFEKDIMKALSADHTLGGACINLSIIESIPDDGSEWPMRGFLMTIEIFYKQNRLTRE